MSIGTEALNLAAAGWPVFPLVANGKSPATEHGLNDATCDADIIRQWWKRMPAANMGIALPSALVAVDVDTKNGTDGFATLAALQDEHGPLPATRTVQTPSGGQHLMFTKPTHLRIKNRTAIRPGLDVRSSGGYLVAPPSVIDGVAYQVLNDCDPAPAPQWLLDVLAEDKSQVPAKPVEASPQRQSGAHDAYTTRAIERATSAVLAAGEGERNATLNASAYGLARLAGAGRLDWHHTAAMLERAGLATGLDPAEIRATLESARAAGGNSPNYEGLPRNDPPAWSGGSELDEANPEPLLAPVDVAGVLTHPSPPPRFVWDGYCPRGVVTLLGAHGGTGKSTIALMLAVAVATGRELFGIATDAAPVVFASFEDGAHLVRHRLAHICQCWGINPGELAGLHIVDGTANPELFASDGRGPGDVTPAYGELLALVQQTGAGLVIVDNASDAYGGDEIQRRQVRAFMRSLAVIAREGDAAVMLLAHVDKGTSRKERSDTEGYSGSTAWHNSARSRIFMARSDGGTLVLEHQKCNLAKLRDKLVLEWPHGGVPQAAQALSPMVQGISDRVDTKALLRLIAEFSERGEHVTTATTSRTHAAKLLAGEGTYPKGRKPADVFDLLRRAERAGQLVRVMRSAENRHQKEVWEVTPQGRELAELPPVALTAPTCADFEVNAPGEVSALTALTSQGVRGKRAHKQVSAPAGAETPDGTPDCADFTDEGAGNEP